MSVDALWQAKRGGFKLGGGQPVLTGPTIVDKSKLPTSSSSPSRASARSRILAARRATAARPDQQGVLPMA